MNQSRLKYIPLLIGSTVGIILYLSVGWWGFLILFPWIGISVTTGLHYQQKFINKKKILGRKICIIMILPALLFFVPLVNHENFQLEGVFLIVLAGYFSKGFIHYAVAKLFGPLIWGRGFCGWACWIAAILDWLPIDGTKRKSISSKVKKIRYITLIISLSIPVILIYIFHYNVHSDYIGKSELQWMIISTIIYYFLSIPLAFYYADQRAFCKILCPVSLVMKVPSRFALLKKRPTGNDCVECGICNKNCPMDIDIMSYIQNHTSVKDTECIMCGTCRVLCPTNAIK